MVAAFEVEIGGPGQVERLVENGDVAGAGIEPDVENVVFALKLAAAALSAFRAFGKKTGCVAGVPNIGGMLGE